MRTETLIIGGGLSGLGLAMHLAEAGRDFRLLEARDRLGGRILNETHGAGHFDLGPAWFWAGQPRIDALIRKLGLKIFQQYADGILTYENEQGQVERGRGFSSMEGSFRLEGGLSKLINAIAERIPAGHISLSTPVTGLTKTKPGISAVTEQGNFEADQVVLAMPPRLASQLTFLPKLEEDVHRQMDGIATWMAGQAKAIAIYDAPFWREAGLSGDAMSRRGPMVEIHDASPATSGPYALFGFIGVPPQARQNEAMLRQAITEQFGRLFGPEASDPKALFVKDWAFDPYTSTSLDLQPLYAHPTYGLPPGLRDIWDGRLILSGTETTPQFGGYLEGALEAAEYALTLLSREKV